MALFSSTLGTIKLWVTLNPPGSLEDEMDDSVMEDIRSYSHDEYFDGVEGALNNELLDTIKEDTEKVDFQIMEDVIDDTKSIFFDTNLDQI